MVLEHRVSQDLPVVFMYSGQGSQYYHMGRELYETNAVFRSAMQELDELIKNKLGESVVGHIYRDDKKKLEPFNDILITHQAIFMVEYSLTRMLIECNIKPDYVLGASLGEITAAAVANILSLDECIDLLLGNARIVTAQCAPGKMLAILGDTDLYASLPILHSNSDLASINFQQHFVVSGTVSALQEISSYLQAEDIAFQFIDVSFGFHSALMDIAKTDIEALLATLNYKQPQIPFVSCAKQQIMDSIDCDHFWYVFRRPVKFWQSIQLFERSNPYRYIDLGPSGTLSTFASYILSKDSGSNTYPLLTPFGQDANNLKNIYDIFGVRSAALPV